MALVLASKILLKQTWEQPTELLKQEQASAAFQSGDLESSWNHLSLWLWQVSWVSTAWSWPSSSVREVFMLISSQAQSWLSLHEWVFPHGIRPGLWIQLCCSSLSDVGCRLLDRNGGRRRYSSKRPAGEIICGSNSDPYFRRSTGSVWTHRVPYPHFLIVNKPHSDIYNRIFTS